jgi:putative hydrolase of HD superfamily
MANVGKLLDFTDFLHRFQQVKRQMRVRFEDRLENDAEHSYQLAMTAFYIIDTNKLDLDLGLVLKYALIHDLVEVYAGDTNTFTKDQSLVDNKQDRELDARKKIAEEFSEFEMLISLIEKYESKEDQESNFIYALDKIITILTNYLDEGRNWKLDGISLKDLIENKQHKVSKNKIIEKYFWDLVDLVEKDEDRLFTN